MSVVSLASNGGSGACPASRGRAGTWHPGRRFRWVVCLTYIGLALLYNALTPIGESPDEIGHFEYVRLVADEARLPGAADRLWQGHQSPLYYVLEAVWARVIQRVAGCHIDAGNLPSRNNPGFPNVPNLNRLVHASSERFSSWTCQARSYHLLRLLSTLLTVPTVLLTFALLRDTVPGAPAMGAAAATVATLLPSHVAITSMLNNDALVNLIIVATTYLVVVAATTGNATALAQAALLAVAGTTAKLSALYLLGLVALGALLRRDLVAALVRQRTARAWLVAAGAAAVLPAAVLARNLVEWGDPFGVGALERNLINLKDAGTYLAPRGMLHYYFAEMPRLFVEGLPVAFGAINFPLWDYFILTRRAVLTIAAGLGLSALLRARWRAVARVPLVLLVAGFALFLATYLFPGYRYRWLQARYFFGQLPLLSLCAAIALFTIWDLQWRVGLRPPDRALVALVYVALLALNVLVLYLGVFGYLYRYIGAGG